MEKKILVFLLFFAPAYVFAQTITFPYLKACKDIPQYDYVQLPDKEIVYPVTGMTDIHMEIMNAGNNAGGGGGLFAVVEFWVIDAKGKIVYNTIYTINPKLLSENQVVTDADYLKYMKRNEEELRKQRRSESL